MSTDYAQIYRNRAGDYDRLVAAEDADGHLEHALVERFDRGIDRIVDVGCGTGRVSRWVLQQGARVVGVDASEAMLAVARDRLASWGDRFVGHCGDARKLPVETGWAQGAVAGWVFGHLLRWEPEGWRESIALALAEMRRVTAPGGPVIVIETLGTGSEQPAPPHEWLAEYYDWMETEHHMQRMALRTDYVFASVQEAVSLCGFFFGQELADRVERQSTNRVPECTGLWWSRA